MTEEEKKAIENVKNMFEGITIDSLNKKSKMTIYCLGIADILLFINAFDKQQEEIEKHEENELILCMDIEKRKKEIEELKQEKAKLKYDLKNNYIDKGIVVKNFISKDKIREKIKELEQIQNTALTGTTIEIMDYKITILKQLLEE